VNSALPLDTRATDTMAMNVEYDWLDPTRPGLRPGWCRTHDPISTTGVARPAWSPRRRTLSLAAGVSARHERLEVMKLRSGRCHQEERRLERHRPGAVDLLWPISTSRIWRICGVHPENDPRLELRSERVWTR